MASAVRMTALLSTLVGVAATLSAPAQATPPLELDPPERLSPEGVSAFNPVAALAPDGDVTVAWVQVPDGFETRQAVAQRFEADGTSGPTVELDRFHWPEFEIVSDSNGGSLIANLGLGGDTSLPAGGDQSLLKLGVTRIDPSGQPGPLQTLWERSRTGRRTLSTGEFAATIDSDDIATLVWSEQRNSPPGSSEEDTSGVRAMQLDPDGGTSPVLTLSRHRGDARDLKVAHDSADRVRVLWRQKRRGHGGRIHLATIGADGGVGRDRVLFKDRGRRVHLYAGLSGDHVSVVRQRRRTTKRALLIAAVRPGGALKQVRVLDRRPHYSAPRLASAPDGSALLAWGHRRKIYAAWLAEGSGRPGRARAISDRPAGERFVRGAQPAVGASGDAVVAWRRSPVNGAAAARVDRRGRPGPVVEFEGGALLKRLRPLVDHRGQVTITLYRDTGVWMTSSR